METETESPRIHLLVSRALQFRAAVRGILFEQGDVVLASIHFVQQLVGFNQVELLFVLDEYLQGFLCCQFRIPKFVEVVVQDSQF